MSFTTSRVLCSLTSRMSRIFAISDIHVDIPENLRLVESWSASEYRNDVLIVAGDVTDNLSLLKTVLQSLTQKFLKVCYVPGTVHIGKRLSNSLAWGLEFCGPWGGGLDEGGGGGVIIMLRGAEVAQGM